MEDREIVAAIAAGDLAGVADAYDKYGESLDGYCRWMLSEPDDAADAVRDTFVVAAGRVARLRDARKLHAWLYAVARNECHRRTRATDVGLDEMADGADLADADADADRAELRRQVQAALSGLNAGEREVLELGLRHDLDGADLAAVLGVSRNDAQALVARARGRLEKALGALIVARSGRRACPALDDLLADWDGWLTSLDRKQISRHIDQCEVCDDRRRGAMRPAALFGMAPLAALPIWLRDEVLRLCADDGEQTLAYRQEVTQNAGPFGDNGFPEVIRQPRPRMVVVSRIAAAAGVVVAVACAGLIAVLALGGTHAPHTLDASRTTSRSASPSAPGSPGFTASAAATAGPSPSSTTPAATDPATAGAPSASPTSAKPSPTPTHSFPASASAFPSASASASAPLPTPTPTLSAPPTTPSPQPSQTIVP